jgi:uncharacterized protein (DUF4415 family)
LSLARRFRAAPAAAQEKPAKPPKPAEAIDPPTAPPKKRGPKPRDDAKVQITLRLGPDVIAAFRATGPGWQSRINEALKASLTRS